MAKSDERFSELAQEIIEKAERIKCDLPTFYAGLREIRQALDDRIAVESEDG